MTRNLAGRDTEDLAEANLSPETPAELKDRQARNLREWQVAYQEYSRLPDGKDKQRKLETLRTELVRGSGTDFPPAMNFQTLTAPPAGPDLAAGREVKAAPLQFGILKPAAPRPEEPVAPGTEIGRAPPIGFAETPAGAVTGLRMPRAADARPESPGINPAEAGRTLLEVGGATAGSVLGGQVGRSAGVPNVGMRAGEAVGAAAGSLVSEIFDPTSHPGTTAMEAGASTLATGTAASAGTAALRRMLGNPTEAGQRLVKIAEQRGEVPLPGAVLEPGGLAEKIQAVGQADVLTGQRIAEKMRQSGQFATEDVGRYINDYLRTKAVAKKAFEKWDIESQAAFGNNRVVYLPPTSLNVIEPVLKAWESRGFGHQFDPTLLQAAKAMREQIDAAASSGGRPVAIKLSMSEAEAVRSMLYENARFRAGAASTGLSEIGDESLARAYRKEAEVVGDHIDNAITQGVKDKRLPLSARADLQGARDLWKQWRQGEVLLDEILPKIESAQRAGTSLTAGELFSSLDRISKMGEKIGKPLISGTQQSYLAGMARAMQAAEDSGKQKMFSWIVRGGQLGLVTGGSIAGGPAGLLAGTALAMTPALFNFITTNPAAAKLIIRGMRVEPGTALAARTSRELVTLLAHNGFIAEPDRTSETP